MQKYTQEDKVEQLLMYCLKHFSHPKDIQIVRTQINYTASLLDSIITYVLKTEQPIFGIYPVKIEYKKRNKTLNIEAILKIKPSFNLIVKKVHSVLTEIGLPTVEAHRYFDYLSQLDYKQSHQKELLAYLMQNSHNSYKQYMPELFGYHKDESSHLAILEESLESCSLLNSLHRDISWQKLHIEEAIKSIAHIHAAYFDKASLLMSKEAHALFQMDQFDYISYSVNITNIIEFIAKNGFFNEHTALLDTITKIITDIPN